MATSATRADGAERRVGGADRAGLRVGVGDARHRLVVGLARLAEDVGGHDLALVLADMGQRPEPGDVADRPQPLAGAEPRVDRDPARVGVDADRLQADARDPRAPAGGDEEPVAAQLAAVVELEHVVVAVAARGGDVRAEDELDAVAAQDVAERLAERRGLAREDVRAALDQRDLAAEAADGLGQLDADGAAAEHEQPARDRLHRGRLAVGPEAVEVAQPGDRRDDGVGAVREHDVRGRVARAADLDRAGAGEPAGPAQQRDALLGEPALLPRVRVVGDHEVAVRERGVDVDLARWPPPRARPCTASPGRSSVFDGMHAQYEHSPPTSSRSTMATRSPPSASAPAQCSPGDPPPRTMTS